MTNGHDLERHLNSRGVVLSIGPASEDRIRLRDILSHSTRVPRSRSTWKLRTSSTVNSALAILRNQPIPVVFCEADGPAGTWKNLLQQLNGLPSPPLLVVTSRLADEALWVEALTRGAYDVLAEPFSPAEVIRTLNSAWLQWNASRRGQIPLDACAFQPEMWSTAAL